MASRLTSQIGQSGGGGFSPHPESDEGPRRCDYAPNVEGHVAWINDRQSYHGIGPRWEVFNEKVQGSTKTRKACRPIVQIGTDDWERQRRAPKAPDKRPKLAW